MDHHIDTRHAFPLTPLFPGLILTYARYLLHSYRIFSAKLLEKKSSFSCDKDNFLSKSMECTPTKIPQHTCIHINGILLADKRIKLAYTHSTWIQYIKSVKRIIWFYSIMVSIFTFFHIQYLIQHSSEYKYFFLFHSMTILFALFLHILFIKMQFSLNS